MINQRFLFVLAVIFIFSFVTGCAKPAVEQSGFLDNYTNLEQGREDGVDKVYFKEGVDFKKYNKVMMDHVVFFFSDDAKYKGVHPDDAERTYQMLSI